MSVPPLVNDVTSTIIVLVSIPVSTIANRNSFQVAMNAKRATTASPGAMMGITTRISARRREQPSMSTGLLDLDRKIAQEPDQEPHREGDVDHRVEGDEAQVVVGQAEQ